MCLRGPSSASCAIYSPRLLLPTRRQVTRLWLARWWPASRTTRSQSLQPAGGRLTEDIANVRVRCETRAPQTDQLNEYVCQYIHNMVLNTCSVPETNRDSRCHLGDASESAPRSCSTRLNWMMSCWLAAAPVSYSQHGCWIILHQNGRVPKLASAMQLNIR